MHSGCSILIFVALSATILHTKCQAEVPSKNDCKGIIGIMNEVAKAADPKNLSADFKQSIRNWMAAGLTCDGPKKIIIMKHQDAAAFATMRELLLASKRPVSLSNDKAAVKIGLITIYGEEYEKLVHPNR